MLFSLKKEGHSDTGYNLDESEDIMLSDVSHSEKDKYYMIPLKRGP